MKRRLFEDESELRSLGNLTLTTHRVIAYARHGVGEASTSVLLDHVQWTRLTSGSHPGLAAVTVAFGALAVTAFVRGAFSIASAISALCLLSLVPIVMWRRTTIAIGSGNGRIKARLDGAPDQHREARGFLDAVDHAAARDGAKPHSGASGAIRLKRVLASPGEASFHGTRR